MRVSIVIPVLNSHEILRRQILHFERMRLPGDVELIIVDDGSNPPLQLPSWVRGHATHDSRPWSWAPARNAGARIAKGDYLLMTDIDHILSLDLVNAVRTFGGQKMQFKRELAVLDNDGLFSQDLEILKEYGLSPERVEGGSLRIGPLPNNFAMRRDIFWEIGGYREDLVERSYPQGEDRLWKKAWIEWERLGKGKVHHERPTIYMFPNGKYCGDVDYNPFGLFHGLSRKTHRNYWYQKQLGKA